ncbi:uncharacterized protein LOC128221069 isoform X1 [Mya arenaria]|uniref:uncharacterized protein LOC128221069 isoform X1 n=1 Tax=Mya arenaria TaxID=6604 RepID=UPI0022DFFED7|nr:uncharacterized protein LOC128221069 isoform X1 [Mya arenaria]XP_052785469.1 uncharacterized protein LOC128221069 isoform X1 [Mya arenaria]XP_052785470.1 uncharacterized protein LOC128221069 isoform X1 [Mya arenaria]
MDFYRSLKCVSNTYLEEIRFTLMKRPYFVGQSSGQKNYEIKDGLNKDRNLDKNKKNPSDISVKHFKSTLGNAFQYIRLGAMSVGEFSECVESTLSAEEIKDILKFPKNCSTKDFHPHRLPKKETLEFKNGKTTWSSCQKSSSRNSGLFSSSSESMYEITVRKSLIICKGITFSEISVLVDILGERFGSMQTTKAVDPNLDFTVKMNIKIARTRLNYSFITTIQDLSAYDLEFDSPICLRASEDPYKVVVKMELQPTPLNITFTTNQCGVGSAEIENAKVEWNNQFSILHKILFSNTSNRVSKGKERKKMDDDGK